jgi:DnaJ-class molecular chaperone
MSNCEQPTPGNVEASGTFSGLSGSRIPCPCCKGTGKQPLPRLVDPSIWFCGYCKGEGFVYSSNIETHPTGDDRR